MDDTTASDTKTLLAHSGPVYAVSFSPDRHYLLSSSEDGTGQLGGITLLPKLYLFDRQALCSCACFMRSLLCFRSFLGFHLM